MSNDSQTWIVFPQATEDASEPRPAGPPAMEWVAALERQKFAKHSQQRQREIVLDVFQCPPDQIGACQRLLIEETGVLPDPDTGLFDLNALDKALGTASDKRYPDVIRRLLPEMRDHAYYATVQGARLAETRLIVATMLALTTYGVTKNSEELSPMEMRHKAALCEGLRESFAKVTGISPAKKKYKNRNPERYGMPQAILDHLSNHPGHRYDVSCQGDTWQARIIEGDAVIILEGIPFVAVGESDTSAILGLKQKVADATRRADPRYPTIVGKYSYDGKVVTVIRVDGERRALMPNLEARPLYETEPELWSGPLEERA